MKNVWDNNALIHALKGDGVAVMPTDTLYGVVGRALSQAAVARIYELRKRNPEKPCIILISDVSELEKFSIKISGAQKSKLGEYWPGPVSIIFDCENDDFWYLHRGTKTLAFRLPKDAGLRELLRFSGPLIAPSANLEGQNPANNIGEARNYFGDAVDLYVDAGEVSAKASKVIRLNADGTSSIIRE